MSSSPIKVLTLGRFYPPSHGGIERHIDDLLRGIGKNIQVDCIVVSDVDVPAELTTTLPYHLYTVRPITTIASTPICPSLPYLVHKLQKENNYDIVHLHFPNPMAHLASYVLPSHVKQVITWHSDIVKQKTLLKFYQPFLKHILQRADAVVAATPKHFSSSQQLKNWGRSENFAVVPFGIDAKTFSASANQADVLAIKSKYPEKKIIFAIGRHVYYKGFEYLIRAMSGIQDAILLLGGTGPLTTELKELTHSLQLENKVIFQGRITDEQLAAYYQAADIFCMPSVEPSEAFGLVQLEAMACQKPIVCCELNNGVTFVNKHEETGLVVPPRDTQALTQALNKLLQNDELRKSLGNNGYHRAITEFSQEKMWNETLNLYRKLLNK